MLNKYFHTLTFLILEQTITNHSNYGPLHWVVPWIRASPRWSKPVVWDIFNQNGRYLFWHRKKVICFLAFAIELYFAQKRSDVHCYQMDTSYGCGTKASKRRDSDVYVPPLSTYFSGWFFFSYLVLCISTKELEKRFS